MGPSTWMRSLRSSPPKSVVCRAFFISLSGPAPGFAGHVLMSSRQASRVMSYRNLDGSGGTS